VTAVDLLNDPITRANFSHGFRALNILGSILEQEGDRPESRSRASTGHDHFLHRALCFNIHDVSTM
jgi:hypothetical protein